MPEAVIVATARSAIGRARKGSLVDIRPDDLAADIIRAALDKVPALDPATIDDIYVGCAEPRDEHGGNMARRIAVQLGLDSVPAVTVNRFCASSVQTARMAFHAIKVGEGDVFVSAGVECVSRYSGFGGAGVDPVDTHNPVFAEAEARTVRYAETNETWHDPRADGELPDVYIQMGQTAENVATAFGVTRHDQDEFAVLSQNRAEQSIKDGFFAREISPVTLPDGRVVDTDDGPRPGTTYEKVAALEPVFRPDGTVTAGNSSSINDGASAILLAGEGVLDAEPLARIAGRAAFGNDPDVFGVAPVEAANRALARAGRTWADVDLVELNEAFASQSLACLQLWPDLDPEKVNVHGGAIAMGHPLGASGGRIIGHAAHELARRGGGVAVATLCIGVGQGLAVVLER